MDKHLLKLFGLADSLYAKQDKVYAVINYTADEFKSLEIIIKTKADFKYLERCQVQLNFNPQTKLKMITDLFNSYVGGVSNE